MGKIYGYKNDDVIELAEFLSKEKQGKLTDKFQKFADEHGKAKGTVRNLYYALAKMSKNEVVSMDVMLRICKVLDCNVGDIMDATKE